MQFNPVSLARRLFFVLFRLKFSVAARRQAEKPIRLATISEGVSSWPLYVAQEKNFFAREGLDVDVTLTGSSVKQLEQLTAGDFDIGFQQSDHVVRGVEHGSDLFIFMAQAHAPELSLVVAPGIRSFADLKGREVAVDGARTGYALLLRKLLADKGLRNGDYFLNEVGGSRERFEALKNGVVSASLLNPPFDNALFASGFGSLGTVDDYFPAYPGSIAAARRSWARDHGTQLIAFICAFNKAYTWLQEPRNKFEALELLQERFEIEPQAAAKAFDRFAGRPRPEVSREGLNQVIALVWNAEGFPPPRGSPEKYMDLSYLDRAR